MAIDAITDWNIFSFYDFSKTIREF